MQSQKISSYLLVIAIVIVLPLAYVFEHKENNTWASRLIFPAFIDEENRHTPIVTSGTFLPPTVKENTTLTVAQNPVILSSTTTIPAGTSLTIQKGVVIYAHEYAALIVEGSLTIQGNEKQPVKISTNEKHDANKVWSGIITQPGGKTVIDQARISFASPAISCMAGSSVVIKNTRLEDGNAGIWQGSQTCTAENVTYKRIKDNIIQANF